MRIEAEYQRISFRIFQGYRCLLISDNKVIYLNFKNNNTITFQLNRERYLRLAIKRGLLKFEPIIYRGTYEHTI